MIDWKKLAKIDFHANWKRVMGLVGADSIVENVLWNCASEDLRVSLEGTGQGIGSSDKNHTVYNRIKRCETGGELWEVGVAWGKELGLI